MKRSNTLKSVIFTAFFVLLSIFVTSCDDYRMDSFNPSFPDDRKVSATIILEAMPSSGISYTIHSSDPLVQAQIPEGPILNHTVELRGIPHNSIVDITVNMQENDKEVVGAALFGGPDGDFEARTPNDFTDTHTFRWKFCMDHEDIRISPIYRREYAITSKNASGHIVTDIGCVKPFDEIVEIESAGKCKFIFDTVTMENIGTQIGDFEILAEYGSSSILTANEGFFNIGIDENNTAPVEVSIEKRRVRIIYIVAPADFDVLWSIHENGTKHSIQKGSKQSVALPYSMNLYLEVDDIYDILHGVDWGGDKGVSDSNKIMYDYADAVKSENIHPVPVSENLILTINEPEINAFVKVYKNGVEQVGKRIDGITEYTFVKGLDNNVLLVKQEYDGFSFLDWGGIYSGSKDARINLDLYSIVTSVIPNFVRQERVPGIIYVRPTSMRAELLRQVDPPVIGLSNMGSEANPFRSLEEAVKAARPGDEIRLFEGKHLLKETLVIDKPLSFTGGWVPGQSEQVTFMLPRDGNGAPTNLRSVICNAVSNERQLINVTASGNVVMQGINILLDTGFDEFKYVVNITSDNTESLLYLDRCKVSTYAENAPSDVFGILCKGQLRVTDSSIYVPYGKSTSGIDAMGSPNSSYVGMTRTDMVIGSDKTGSAYGIKTNSNNANSFISRSSIKTEAKGGIRGITFARAIVMNSGRITENLIEAYASCPGPFAIASAIETSSCRDLVIDNNRMIGRGKYEQADSSFVLSLVNFNGGRVYLVNNIIELLDSDGPQFAVSAQKCSFFMAGNIVHSAQGAKYVQLAFAYDCPASMFLNNTFMSDGLSMKSGDETSNSCHLGVLKSERYEGTSKTAIINNLFIAGDAVVQADAVKFQKVGEFLLVNNAFVDFTDPTNRLYKNAESEVSEITSLNDMVNIKDNIGESIGEQKDGWSRSMLRKDLTGSHAELHDAPDEVRNGGRKYTQNDIMKIANYAGLELPQGVIHDFASFLNDMYGNTRRDFPSIGALQAQ